MPSLATVTLDELIAQATRLEQEGQELVARADSPDSLAAVRTALLGRKSGRLTQLMKALPALPAESRGAAGAAVNRAKTRLEAALTERESAIGAAAPGAPTTDLTMPARRQWRGAKHPVTLVI